MRHALLALLVAAGCDARAGAEPSSAASPPRAFDHERSDAEPASIEPARAPERELADTQTVPRGLSSMITGGQHPPIEEIATARSSALRSPIAIDAADCARCHAREHAEWLRSAHRRAYVDPLFQREWQPRQRAFCVGCHAPRGASAREQGVDCASCHVREGSVIASTVSGRAPHVSRADPSFAGAGMCARCHQFSFPHQPELPMQDTVSEGQRSSEIRPCQSCHEGHAFRAATGQPALHVRGRAERDGWTTWVELDIAAGEVGHAVPTGDLFRQLEVRAWPEGDEERARCVRLRRRFTYAEGRYTELADERIPPPGAGSRTLVFRLRGTARRVRWEARIWPLDPHGDAAFELGELVRPRRIAHGALDVGDWQTDALEDGSEACADEIVEGGGTGAVLYRRHCASCHERPAPSWRRLTLRALGRRIREGGGGMPAFALSPGALRRLTTYVRRSP